jgi:hypothetical protein
MGNPLPLTIPTWNTPCVVHSSRAALGEGAFILAQKYISMSQPKRTSLHARRMRVQTCLQAYLEREAIKAHIRTNIQRFKAGISVYGCFPPRWSGTSVCISFSSSEYQGQGPSRGVRCLDCLPDFDAKLQTAPQPRHMHVSGFQKCFRASLATMPSCLRMKPQEEYDLGTFLYSALYDFLSLRASCWPCIEIRNSGGRKTFFLG